MSMKYSLIQFEDFENKQLIVIPPLIVDKVKENTKSLIQLL